MLGRGGEEGGKGVQEDLSLDGGAGVVGWVGGG